MTQQEKSRITVGIPAYNCEDYIENCIRSIEAQTLEDECELEVICVNDGSTDNTKEVLYNLAEEFINLRVITTKNMGAYEARKTIIREATGEWIGFVDADDLIEPAMYGKLYSMVVKDKETDVAVCAMLKETQSGETTILMQTYGDSTLDLRDNPEYSCSINPSFCNKLFRGSLAKQIVEIQTSPSIMEDLIFWASIVPFIRKVAFTTETLYIYRYVENSVTKTIGLNEYEKAEGALEKLISYYDEFCSDSRSILEALTIIHLGIAFTINASDRDVVNGLWHRSIEYLNANFPGWKKNECLAVKNINKKGLGKAIIAYNLFATPLWKAVIVVYKFFETALGINLKW